MDVDELKSFFSKLADKFRKENDLSDVTWALCESCPEFETLFLNFFFNEIKDTAGIKLEREYTRGFSRPDFFFESNQNEYIIEVKKEDKNDHFEQYLNDFKDARFGWIANYKVTKPEKGDIEIRTWEQFKTYLEHINSLNDLDASTKETIESYCLYLQNVCSIIKFKKMKLDNLSSLFLFNTLIEKIIETPIDNVECNVYTKSKGFTNSSSGLSFTVAKKSFPENLSYPWFGIYYDKETTCICVSFGEIWCRTIFNGVKQNPQEGKFYLKPYIDSAAIWFELRKEYFDEFNKEESAEKQEQMLTDFFKEVIEKTKQYL